MSRTQHLLRSSLLVTFIFGLNKITGFGKLFLVTQAFGTGPEADAYAAANQLPELFYAMLAGGTLAAALIPVYSAYLSSGEQSNATKLANTVLTLILLGLGSLCAVAILFAPWLTRTLLVPEFAPNQQTLTASLMRIVLFSTVLYGLGNVYSSLLHARQHFFTPALGTVVIDSGQILGLYFLAPYWGIYGAAWGSVLGVTLYFCVQIPALVRHRIGYRPQLALRLAGTRELVRLMGPRVISLGAFQAVDLVFIRLASQLSEGSISAFFYAYLIIVAMPKSLFGTAISTVIFPTLAEQYNTGENRDLKITVVQGLRAVWALLIPASVGLLALGRPAIAFLLERGAFDAEGTALVYSLITILAIRLISDASYDILSLPFYAHHNTQIPMWANLGWMALNVGLSIVLVGPLGIQGLAWATTLSSVALALGLYYLNQQILGPLHDPILGQTFVRSIAASIGMGLLMLAIRQVELSTIGFLTVAMSTGMIVYIVLYALLGGREILSLWHMFRGADNRV